MFQSPTDFTTYLTVGSQTDGNPAPDAYNLFNGFFDTTHSVASAGGGSITSNLYNGFTVHDIFTQSIAFLVSNEVFPFVYGFDWKTYIILYDNGLTVSASSINNLRIGTTDNARVGYTNLGSGYHQFEMGAPTDFASAGWTKPAGEVETIVIT